MQNFFGNKPIRIPSYKEDLPQPEESQCMLLQILSLDGTIIFASSSHKTMIKIDPDGLEGTNFYDLLHPDDRWRIDLKSCNLITIRAKLKSNDQDWQEFNCSFKLQDELEIIILSAAPYLHTTVYEPFSGISSPLFSIREPNNDEHHFIKDLHRAIKHQEFTLHYQPLFNLNTQEIKVEALVRWNHPTRGLIPPSVFIPFAEKHGQIVGIGGWVLYTATKQVKEWGNACSSKLKLSLNISSKQVESPEFLNLVNDALDASKLDPYDLELEITETSLMKDIPLMSLQLEKLRKKGIKISIDDFGSYFSSLNYLKDLPVDIIKIDRSFIKDLPADKKGVDIVGMIIDLGHRLSLDVTAEGVETSDQLKILQKLKCDCIQGYFLSKPLPPQLLIQQLSYLKSKIKPYLLSPNKHIL